MTTDPYLRKYVAAKKSKVIKKELVNDFAKEASLANLYAALARELEDWQAQGRPNNWLPTVIALHIAAKAVGLNMAGSDYSAKMNPIIKSQWSVLSSKYGAVGATYVKLADDTAAALSTLMQNDTFFPLAPYPSTSITIW